MVKNMLMTAALTVCASFASAQQSVNVFTNDGQVATARFADNPEIAFSGNTMTLTSSSRNQNFAMSDISQITFADNVSAANPGNSPTGVYVGGYIRRERPATIATLKHSGFTYVILFNVTVEEDGTLTTDGETVCKDGRYVFGETQPHYVADVKALKASPTSINRIEICIGGWGNASYTRIKNLVNSQGTGSSTMLYRNFRALKDAIPEIDAVNNDDEECYDVNTAAAFHEMMYALGYKTTVAPYTNHSFWSGLTSRLGSKCDRILVQCYDGGAGNNPSDWGLNGATRHAGRTNYQSDMTTSISQMASWRDNNGVAGGFVWVYNDDTWNLNAWAAAMNRTFRTLAADSPVATFYSDSDYKGYAVGLPAGSFAQGEMALYGIQAMDISSLKVSAGYKVTFYTGVDCTGESKTFTSDASFVGSDWNDKACSIKIESNGARGKDGIWKIRNRNSGKYLDLDNNRTDNNTAIVQYDDEGTDPSQQWLLREVKPGIYAVLAASNTARGFDVADASGSNGAQVQLYDYLGNPHQEFILYEHEQGYYEFIASHCSRVVEIPESRKDNGEWIKLWDKNDTHTQQWALEHNVNTGANAATFFQDINYGGSSATLGEGSYTTYDMRLYGLSDDDITSLKVQPGYKVTVYKDDNFTGDSKVHTTSTGWVGDDWNDKISSLKIEAEGVSGMGGAYKIEGVQGHRYLNISGASTANNALAEHQPEDIGSSQEFRLVETGNGIYQIMSLNSGLYLDVCDASKEEDASLQQFERYKDSHNQQFILVEKGGGEYQFVARHSGMALAIADGGNKVSFTYDGSRQNTLWTLNPVDTDYSADITESGIATASHDAVNNGENIEKLYDNNPSSKYCADINAGDRVTLAYRLPYFYRLTSYSLTSANDEQGRDPGDWVLQGSKNGRDWVDIDSRSGEIFPDRQQRKRYSLDPGDSYHHFRLVVNRLKNPDSKIFQLAELQLFGEKGETVSGIASPVSDGSRSQITYRAPIRTLEAKVAEDGHGHFAVYSAIGNTVMARNLEAGSHSIYVGSLPDGIYIVSLDGETLKFVKK